MRHSHLRVQSTRAFTAFWSALRRARAGVVEYLLLMSLVAVGLLAMLFQFRNHTGRIDSSNPIGSAGS